MLKLKNNKNQKEPIFKNINNPFFKSLLSSIHTVLGKVSKLQFKYNVSETHTHYNILANQYIDYNVFFDEYGEQAVPTVIFTDLDNNTWIGTDSGYLFSAWRNSNKLEIIDPGIQKGIISGAYIDA